MRTFQLGCVHQPIFEVGQITGPFGFDQVVHAHSGGFVDGHIHGLAPKTPVDEMVDQVLGDLGEPPGSGDQLVLLGETTRDRLLLSLVQLGLFEQVLEFVVEVVVGPTAAQGYGSRSRAGQWPRPVMESLKL